MTGNKKVSLSEAFVLIPKEHWDEFETAVLEAARRLGTVEITSEILDPTTFHVAGDRYLIRGGLTMRAYRTESWWTSEWRNQGRVERTHVPRLILFCMLSI